MGTPVVISRIQNRRGTQSEFEALYPPAYTSAPGATSSGDVVTVADTANLTVGRTPIVTYGTGQFAPNTVITSIDSTTQFTVSAIPIIPLSGPNTIVHVEKYNGIGKVTGNNILQPGELALCTDTGNVYMGLNDLGEYIELSTDIATISDLKLSPNSVVLPPQSSFAPVSSGMEWTPTPFLSILYDVTDSTYPGPVVTEPNTVGVNFSKNGELKITSIQGAGTDSQTLTDNGTEINKYPFYIDPMLGNIQPDISFTVVRDGGLIKLYYKHNFPVPLTFSTSSIIWAPILV